MVAYNIMYVHMDGLEVHLIPKIKSFQCGVVKFLYRLQYQTKVILGYVRLWQIHFKMIFRALKVSNLGVILSTIKHSNLESCRDLTPNAVKFRKVQGPKTLQSGDGIRIPNWNSKKLLTKDNTKD